MYLKPGPLGRHNPQDMEEVNYAMKTALENLHFRLVDEKPQHWQKQLDEVHLGLIEVENLDCDDELTAYEKLCGMMDLHCPPDHRFGQNPPQSDDGPYGIWPATQS